MPGDGWFRVHTDALVATVRSAVADTDNDPSAGDEHVDVRTPGTDDSNMLIRRDETPAVEDGQGNSRRAVKVENPSWGQVELGLVIPSPGHDHGTVEDAEGDKEDDVCVWDMSQTPHLFLVGGTGRGKTTLGTVLANAWLSEGWDVVWASPTAGADPVPDGAVIVSDPVDVAKTFQQVGRVVEERVDALKHAGVSRFDQLDPVPVPVLVVVDGAFAYTGAAVASKGPSRRVRAVLTEVLSHGRAVGVSVVLFSHTPQDVLRVRAFASNLPGRGVFLDCDDEVWAGVFGGKPRPRLRSQLFTGGSRHGAAGHATHKGVVADGPGVVAVMVPRRGRRSGPVVTVKVREPGVAGAGVVGGVRADGPRWVADE